MLIAFAMEARTAILAVPVMVSISTIQTLTISHVANVDKGKGRL